MKGAEALASLLAESSTLTRLALNDNYLGPEGARALAAALTTNSSIRELQLRGNELGDGGVEAIAEALMVRGRAAGVVWLGRGFWLGAAPGADVLIR